MRWLLLAALFAATAATAATPKEEAAYDRYRRPDLLVNALALERGQRVAEIGAGSGYLTIPIARRLGPKGRVVATDIDAKALDAMRARGSPSTIEPRLVAAGDPGLGEERFDLILLAEVDHLLPDRASYLGRLRAHLREGGRIAISNKRWDQEALLRDARAAGLEEKGEFTGLPAHFLLFFGASLTRLSADQVRLPRGWGPNPASR